MWKKRLQILLWCVLGCACVVLLVAAIAVKSHKTCSDIQVTIDDKGDKLYINEKDITQVLKEHNVLKGTEVEQVHLGAIESDLQKNAWIKNAQLFFDNNQVLTVKIKEREPVARIFTLQGASFYIDSAANRLPLSDKFSARVPVFTSFPSEKKVLTGADSAALQGVKHIAQFIQQDSFWMAQVAQIDITPQHTYEMIPVLGDQVIRLGDADNLSAKFGRLMSFYKQVWSKTGFEKYSAIDVQYEGQVVAVKRGMVVAAPDSAMAMQQYANGLANQKGVVKDTIYASVEKKAEDLAKDSLEQRKKLAAAVANRAKKVKPAAKKANAGKKPAAKGAGKKQGKAVLPRRRT